MCAPPTSRAATAPHCSACCLLIAPILMCINACVNLMLCNLMLPGARRLPQGGGPRRPLQLPARCKQGDRGAVGRYFSSCHSDSIVLCTVQLCAQILLQPIACAKAHLFARSHLALDQQVWIQVETKECFEAIDDVLSVPGIHCAFLGESRWFPALRMRLQSRAALAASSRCLRQRCWQLNLNPCHTSA